MKNKQGGFIQIPLLFALIALGTILAGSNYYPIQREQKAETAESIAVEKAKVEGEKRPPILSFQDKIKPIAKDRAENTKIDFKPTIQTPNTNSLIALFDSAKANWEELYGATETNKRIFLESELWFLDSRINNLETTISSITDCGVSTAPDVARINTTYNNQIEEYKRIYQKNIDSKRAYGLEQSALLEEKALADKVAQIERERDVEIGAVKTRCESGLGLLKTLLQTVLDSVKRGRSNVAEYTSSYSTLQESIKREVASIELQKEELKNGQYKETVAVYDAYYQKIRSVVLQLNQLNSSVERKVGSIDSNYKMDVDSAFRNTSIVQGVTAELNAISGRAQEYGEAWKAANTPMRCNATSEFSSGQTDTRITCEGVGATITNPVRCHSTSEWLSGQLNTRMVCEQN